MASEEFYGLWLRLWVDGVMLAGAAAVGVTIWALTPPKDRR